MLENIGPTFLEPINASQIWDKFPSQNGLKDLVNAHKKPCFFMIKIWVHTFIYYYYYYYYYYYIIIIIILLL